jgi:hypothetical protein
MSRYKVGDTVLLKGSRGRVVWLSENSAEIESMDEYIVEFENRQRRFFIASELEQETPHQLCG